MCQKERKRKVKPNELLQEGRLEGKVRERKKN